MIRLEQPCYWAPVTTKSRRETDGAWMTHVSRPRQASLLGEHTARGDDPNADRPPQHVDVVGTAAAASTDHGVAAPASPKGRRPKLRPPKPTLPSHGHTVWSEVNYPRGGKYVGYVKRESNKVSGRATDQRHGYGELFYFDGRLFKGEWYNNAKNGKGSETRADGLAVFWGTWRHGLRHGRGKIVYLKGSENEGKIEKGVWREGKLDRVIAPGLDVGKGKRRVTYHT